MSNGNNFQSTYELNSRWSHRLAYFILFGLAVEIIGVFIPPICPWVPGAITILSASLIWIGVWGELHFSAKAKEAGDGIVAEAKKEAAEANERAAKAELETERLREKHGWRVLNPSSFTELAMSLRGATASVLISYPLGDIETAGFVTQLSMAFRQSGWKVGFSARSYVAPITWGIVVPTTVSDDTLLGLIRNAFSAANLTFTSTSLPVAGGLSVQSGEQMFLPVAEIYVGPMERY